MFISKKEFDKRVRREVNKERARVYEEHRRRTEISCIWSSLSNLEHRVWDLEHPDDTKEKKK